MQQKGYNSAVIDFYLFFNRKGWHNILFNLNEPDTLQTYTSL